MPSPTYIPIATTTLATATQTVSFTNITQQYRDLVIVFSGTLSVNGSLCIDMNGDYSTNYYSVDMFGTGSGQGSGTGSYVASVFFGRSYAINSSQVVMATANLMDYSASDKHKTMLTRGSASGQLVEACVTRWANNSPVTTFRVFNNFGNIAAGTTISVYGVVS